MPRINRFRIVNFTYGYGTRIINDMISELAGEDTLLNLINSGGKTTLLHILSQCVVPGAPLGTGPKKRDLNSYFDYKSKTSHILIEWLLDNNSGYLLTGLTAAGSPEGVKYYNYFHHYRGQNPYDIDHIPVFNDNRQVTPFNQFRALLDKSKDDGIPIRVYSADRKAQYLEQLKNFDIIGREWQLNLKTNAEEGGVGKYFTQFDTAGKFIGSVVKEVEKQIDLKDDEDTNGTKQIKQSLMNHYETLKELPKIEENLRVLSNVIEDITIWRNKTYDLKLAGNDLTEKANRLAQFYGSILAKKKLLDTQLSEVQEEITKAKELKDDLGWKVASYKVFELKQEVDFLAGDIAANQGILAENKIIADNIRKNINEVKAAGILSEIKPKESQLIYYKTSREAMFEEDGEIRSQYEPLTKSLSVTYRDLLDCVNKEITDGEQSLALTKRDLVENTKELEAAENGINKINIEIGVHKGKLESFNQAAERTRKHFGLEFLELESNAQLFVDELDKKIKQTESKLGNLKNRLIVNKETVAVLEKSKSELETNKASIHDEIQNKHAELAQRNRNIATALEILMPYQIDRELLFNGEGLARLNGQKTTHEIDLNKDSAAYHEACQNYGKVEGKDFYVASRDITVLQKYLFDKGITEAISGSEYIQTMQDDEKREQLLEKCPLLPYGVIVDSTSVERILKLKGKFNPPAINHLIPVFLREQVAEDVHFSSMDLHWLLDAKPSSVLFARPDDTSFYLSKESFAVLKEKLQRYVTLWKERVDNHKQAITKLDGFICIINSAVKDNPLYVFDQLEKEIIALSGQESRAAAQIEQLGKRFDDNKSEEKQLIAAIVSYEGKLNVLRDNLGKAGVFRDELKVADDSRLALLDAEVVLSSLSMQKLELQKSIRELNNNKEDITARLNFLRVKSSELDKIKGVVDAALPGPIPKNELVAKIPNNELDKVMGQWKALGESLISRIKEAENLNSIITDITDDIAGLQKKFAKCKCSIEAAEAVQDYSEEYLDILQEREQQIRDVISKAANKIELYTQEVNKKKDFLEAVINDVRTEFKEEPYDKFSELDRLFIAGLKNELSATAKKIEGLSADELKLKGILESFTLVIEDAVRIIKEENIDVTGIQSEEFTSETPRIFYIPIQKEYYDAKKQVGAARTNVEDAVESIQSSYSQVGIYEVNKLLSFLTGSNNIGAGIYDYEVVSRTTDNLQKNLSERILMAEDSKQELETKRHEIASNFADYLIEVLDEFPEIERKSRIKLGDRYIKCMRFELDKDHRMPGNSVERENYIVQRMKEHIDSCIPEIDKVYKDGHDSSEISKVINRLFSTSTLLGKVVNLDTAEVKVWKFEMFDSLSDYVSWEKVIGGQSGGENVASTFCVYISLLAYMHGGDQRNDSATKVVLVDNPFGQANAKHLVNPIFKIAEQNNTQLLVLTGLKESGIFQNFDRIYNLSPRLTLDGSKLKLITENVKAGSGHITLEKAYWGNVSAVNTQPELF